MYVSGWCNARSGWEVAGIDYGALYCMEAPPLLQTPTTPYLLILWVNLLEGERFGKSHMLKRKYFLYRNYKIRKFTEENQKELSVAGIQTSFSHIV